MNKAITAIQILMWLYIYGKIGQADLNGCTFGHCMVSVLIAFLLFAVLQAVKKPACKSRRA